jgi:hypothetical protein
MSQAALHIAAVSILKPKKCNELLHLPRKKKMYKRRIFHDQSIPTNDGLLHYALYRIVIAPSFQFYETLCVAEQGQKNDADHQEPMFHSIIPNPLAMDYDNRMKKKKCKFTILSPISSTNIAGRPRLGSP